jgi:hypothetical protein
MSKYANMDRAVAYVNWLVDRRLVTAFDCTLTLDGVIEFTVSARQVGGLDPWSRLRSPIVAKLRGETAFGLGTRSRYSTWQMKRGRSVSLESERRKGFRIILRDWSK